VRKNSTLAYIVTIMMVFALLAPIVIAPPVQAAGIPDIVQQMQDVYPYLEQADKDAIQAARQELQGIPLNDARWNTVLGVGTANNLLTSQVIAQFEGVDEAEKTAAAKEALINVAIGLGNIYYSQDTTTLGTDLTNFKEANKATFQKLFGTTTSVDDLYQLLQATRGQFATVISTNSAYLDDLAFGSNATLVDTIPKVLDDAMQNVLNTTDFNDFRGKLEAIGWSTTKLINQQKELGNIIDSSKAARLALAKAAVRSESELFYDDNGTRVLIPKGEDTKINVNLNKDDVVVYALKIMGQEAATTMVEWESSDPSVASVAYVEGTTDIKDYPVVTANKAGTTTITAYRYDQTSFPEGTAANDWVLKFDVTVDAPPVTVTGISVKTAPTKTIYNAGERLDLTGLVVTLTKSDSTSEDVAFADFVANGITVSPANEAVLAITDTKVTLTHTASGNSVDQAITVNQVETKYAITVADVVGGTATVTTDPATEAAGGTSVTVSITNIETGKQFKSITVTDADSGLVATTEVTAGASYTFTMPVKTVTVTVAVEEIPVVGLYGDVNKDSAVDSWDAFYILLYDSQLFNDICSEATDIFANNPAIADINGDESIDSWDAFYILLYDSQLFDEISGVARIKLGL
jgi:hypothetical protein